MASEQAFRVVARRCLIGLTTRHHQTSIGDPRALHQMRVALTRLRAAVAFFTPIASEPEWERLKREFKWINGYLGATRDLDVFMHTAPGDGAAGTGRRTGALDRRWVASHLRLTRALHSRRYQRLIASLSAWIDREREPVATDARSRTTRLLPISTYATRVLTRWHREIVEKSRKLDTMTADKRHRLRIRTKKLRYAIEWFGGLPPRSPPWQRAMLKQLRKAQDALGELNDAACAEALAKSSRKVAQDHKQDHKQDRKTALVDARRERRLLSITKAAYQKLGKLASLSR